MTETLMHVDAVSKKFCRSLKRSLWYGVKDLGRELSGATGDRSRLRRDEFWALKDVSFVLRRGETLGVIGHNGAGKTSLLRLLNGLIKPDEGRIEVRGRMQALIALGAGFDPVLTGRENIYINAAVLGMSKAEVDRRFDEIVDFSGIPDFIDTPLQSYSSGMRVRLGFAVAAHMSPDILLVDEVLAVGDLAFRAKCLSRIEELISGGVAVILVSHSLYIISSVCKRALVMEQGRLLYDGETAGAVDRYRSSLASRLPAGLSETGTGEIVITGVQVLDESDRPAPDFGCGNEVRIRLSYHARRPVLNPVPNIVLRTLGGEQVIGVRTDQDGVFLGELSGHGTIDLVLPEFNLLPGIYVLTVTLLHAGGIASYDRQKEVATISVRGGNTTNGLIYLQHRWQQRVAADSHHHPLQKVGTG